MANPEASSGPRVLLPPGPRCGRHPAVEAIDLCTRCGHFVCGRCVRTLAGEVGCEECAGRREQGRADGPLPQRVWAAWLLTSAGLLLPLLLVPALVLTWNPRGRVLREGYPPRAERWLFGAHSLAKAITGLWLLMLVPLTLMFAMFLWR